MTLVKSERDTRNTLLIIGVLLFSHITTTAQDYRFGVYASPVISWFSTDVSEISNQGARPGFIFSVTAERYFHDNYALTAGISLINAGGRLVNELVEVFEFPNYNSIVDAGSTIVYRLQYLSIPAGVKLKTNEIGYLAIFSDIGIDPKMVVRSRVDIPSLDIKGEGARTEVKRFNLGYHINAGVEYSLGGTTSASAGLGFESNFFDTTKDNGQQLDDRVSHKFLKFIFGVNF